MPHLHRSQMLQVYTPDEKCVGMLSTKPYTNLIRQMPSTKHRIQGYHNQVIPPPKDLNSELVGLLSYKKECTSKVHKQISQKVRLTHMSLTWPHTSSTSNSYCWQGQNSIWLSFGSSFKEVWSKRKRNMVLGSNFNPLPTETGFSVCHPLYDDSVMLKMVRHAIYSSLSTESATAIFPLLPNRKGLNANAYMQMLRKYPEHCTILGTIPQASVTYRRQDFWIGNNTSSQLLNGILKLLL